MQYQEAKRTIKALTSELKEIKTLCCVMKEVYINKKALNVSLRVIYSLILKSNCLQQMEEMKEKEQKLILGDDLYGKEKNNAHDRSINEGYFNTYSHFAIHHEMLTVSYK